MPNVVFEEKGPLNAIISITVERKDYEEKLTTELNKFRQKAQMKGFRKGKTPDSMVRKLYGKGVLGDIINDLLGNEMNAYLEGSGLDYLGQPLPADDQELIEFDLNRPTDYTFRFEIGLAPQFSIVGLNGEKTHNKWSIIVPAEVVEEELTLLRKREGERLAVAENFQADDLLKLEATENDPQGEALVKTIDVLFSDLGESFQEKVIALKVGDSFEGDIYGLEKNRDEIFVRRYLLGLAPGEDRYVNPNFTFKILEASRVELAELDQTFFDQAFGEDHVHSAEEAKEWIAEAIRKAYDNQANGLLYRDLQEYLLAENPIPLPDDFLKKWIGNSNSDKSPEDIEKEYPEFARALRWSMISGKLARENDIQVQPEEIEAYFISRVAGYFGGSNLPPDLVKSVISRFMEDEKQVNEAYEDVIRNKVADLIIRKTQTNPIPIELNAFKQLFEEQQAQRRMAEAARFGEEE